MSLNRCEQRLHDYWDRHRDERQFWRDKVRRIAAAGALHPAAERLEAELWTYYLERSAVVPSFREAARREGLQRTSMRNLVEILLRLETDLRPKPPAQNQI